MSSDTRYALQQEPIKGNKYLVDLIIPAYHERDYIQKTLHYLTKQTLYQKGLMNIVVGEYRDSIDNNIGDGDYLEKMCSKLEHCTYVNVDQKGISYARNMSILKGTKSDIFCNFDADSIFNRVDAVEYMIRPILNKEKVLTNCQCILFDFKRNLALNQGPSTDIYSFLAKIGDELEKHLFFSRGPGLTVSKDAFIKVGGFRTVDVAEDYWLAFDICHEYGLIHKQYIPDVKVLTSDRRAKASKKDGLGVFSYDQKAYR